MKRPTIQCILLLLSMGFAGHALACEYIKGETRFADYAGCRYGEDSVVAVDLPEGSGWDQCVYYTEAFRPAKLLAITRMEDGKEIAVPNDRSQIGNPCYLLKQKCDQALKASNSSGY
jgi:hypothetical protein